MKTRKITLILIATLVVSLFTACASKPKTLEQYFEKDTKTMQEIQDVAQQANMDIQVSDNTITFSYDLSSISGVTKEVVQSDEFKSTLESELAKQASTFEGLCQQIEDETKIANPQLVVQYTFEGETIVEQTFSNK